jgi:hypothetical protein
MQETPKPFSEALVAPRRLVEEKLLRLASKYFSSSVSIVFDPSQDVAETTKLKRSHISGSAPAGSRSGSVLA